MNFPQNNWDWLRAHYRQYAAAIEAQDSDEWAIDAYAWETGMMTMTPIEAWLWADIRQANAVFYPQYPVGRFFVDFANPKAKVAIECDGAAYHLDKAKDAARDKELERMGWTVYRITGAECRKDFDDETRAKSPGALLLEEVCEQHPVQRYRRPSTRPEGFSTFGAHA